METTSKNSETAPRPLPATTAAPLPCSEGRKSITAGAVIMVVAVLLPVLGTLWVTRFSTGLWLASMPLCFVGVALVAAGLLRRHHLRQAQREDWG